MLNIRRALPEDAPLIVELIRELADYEKMSDLAMATPDDIVRDGWGPLPKFRCVIAEWREDGASPQPAGFALFFYNYSTFQGRPGIYLEDLFVRPKFRGKGIGKALLVHLAQLAVKEKCGRFQWQVLDWNAPSIAFYQSLGAEHMKEWLTMRVEGEALIKLAASEVQPLMHAEKR